MSAFYNKGKERILKQWHDGGSAKTIKAMFMAPAYTPDVDSHQFVSDISASRASGTTDQTLASIAIAADNTNNRAEFDAADLSVATVTTSTDMIVLYESTGVDATSTLLCYIDIAEGTISPVSGTLAITWNSEGIFAV